MYSCPGTSSKPVDTHPATSRPTAKAPAWQGQRHVAGRRVAGTVYRETAPAPGATVRLIEILSNTEVAVAQADASGRFDLGTVAAASYVVSAESAKATGAISRVDLRDPGAHPDQLRLVKHDCGASIFGIVGDASGGPVANARIALLGGAGSS